MSVQKGDLEKMVRRNVQAPIIVRTKAILRRSHWMPTHHVNVLNPARESNAIGQLHNMLMS